VLRAFATVRRQSKPKPSGRPPARARRPLERPSPTTPPFATGKRREIMPRKPFLMACLMIVSCGVVVASCETPAAFLPRAEDLRVQPKPVPSEDVLTSRVAGERHDNAVEAWGEAGWAQVGRLCRFFDEIGMKGLDCPPPETRPRPG
jgi:hypothetical protein